MQIMYVISADSTTENIALEVMFPSGSWPSDRMLDAVFLLQATTEDTDILYYLALQKYCPFLSFFFLTNPQQPSFKKR